MHIFLEIKAITCQQATFLETLTFFLLIVPNKPLEKFHNPTSLTLGMVIIKTCFQHSGILKFHIQIKVEYLM